MSVNLLRSVQIQPWMPDVMVKLGWTVEGSGQNKSKKRNLSARRFVNIVDGFVL